MTRVLGIDLASSWANLGSAVIAFDDRGHVTEVVPGPLSWPRVAFSPERLAEEIDRLARDHGIVAVALDGPQGWRDPATDPSLPGVGRRCDLAARTQGKVGVRGRTWPSNQRPWVEHCIDTFADLLARPDVVLADAIGSPIPRGGYLVAECYPTSAWRSAGLRPLPSKAKRPTLAEHYSDLARRFSLPAIEVASHDDLQAIVAALTAAAAAGVGPLRPVIRGVPSRTLVGPDGAVTRIEGLIWDAVPDLASEPPFVSTPAPLRPPRPPPRGRGHADDATVYVTRGVVEHVARGGNGGQQIALRGFPNATRTARVRVRFTLAGYVFSLVVGDSHAAWSSHQDDEETRSSFETLFAMLADAPDQREPVADLTVTS